MHAVQVSFHADAQRRHPETLLAAWPTLSGVAAGVARAGVDISVVQAAHRNQTLERDGVAFHFVDDSRASPIRLGGGVSLPRRPGRLIDRVISLAPDVVHVQGLDYPLAVRQLTKAVRGVPVLVQDHGTSEPAGLRRAAWRWSYRFLDGVAFTARDQATPFFEAGALRRDLPVFEVLEGSSRFAPGDRVAARQATGMFGEPCVLWTGRLDANKDPLTMLQAFERAAPDLGDARLWCCFGTAPLLDAVERRIADSPVLRERVTLLGARPHAEMELRFRAADFFVQTSHRESTGFSMLEALSCGTPALVTDIPAARRILGQAAGSAGALTPVGDADALAARLIEWGRETAGRDMESRRRAARERFEQALTFNAIGHELRAAYQSLALTR
jgi:glycosyltransferase involved in cell wall biosynthesis